MFFCSSCYLKLYLLMVPLLRFPYFLLHSFQAFFGPYIFLFTPLPGDHGTRGPEHYTTTGPEDHTRGPQDQRTRGPQDQRTTGPEDHRTRGPQDQRTTGPEDQRTTLSHLGDKALYMSFQIHLQSETITHNQDDLLYIYV